MTLTARIAKPLASKQQKVNKVKYDLTLIQLEALIKMKQHLIVKRYQESTLKTYLSGFV